MNHLHLMDYYEGNPKALLTEQKRKIKTRASKRKEPNIANEAEQTSNKLLEAQNERTIEGYI